MTHSKRAELDREPYAFRGLKKWHFNKKNWKTLGGRQRFIIGTLDN